MKLSVSLSEADLALLDECVKRDGLTSRSAGVQNAIQLLGKAGLQDAYAEAWGAWSDSEDAALWDGTVADGLDGDSRAAR
ncbi:antitoxin [Actinomyces sp. ZJ308]|uniref:antitoxin n=1 Tax=Actinomyces sp. ZJ308 TaxID=2708342 RepID=UPI00141ED2E4|nr:antitoxin [Actinomyces sp. ZJ308]